VNSILEKFIFLFKQSIKNSETKAKFSKMTEYYVRISLVTQKTKHIWKTRPRRAPGPFFYAESGERRAKSGARVPLEQKNSNQLQRWLDCLEFDKLEKEGREEWFKYYSQIKNN